MGIEPTAQAWEAWVLPLYDARFSGSLSWFTAIANPGDLQRLPVRFALRLRSPLTSPARSLTYWVAARFASTRVTNRRHLNCSSTCRSRAAACRLVSFARPMMATSSACCSGVIPLLRAAAPCEAMQYLQPFVTLTAI